MIATTATCTKELITAINSYWMYTGFWFCSLLKRAPPPGGTTIGSFPIGIPYRNGVLLDKAQVSYQREGAEGKKKVAMP